MCLWGFMRGEEGIAVGIFCGEAEDLADNRFRAIIVVFNRFKVDLIC